MSADDLQDLATERGNPRTRDLDLLPTLELLRVMNEEDRRVPEAVACVLPSVAQAVDRAAAILMAGGRMHIFGAGTSGRLGVLDASEIPPTFGVEPTLVQGHLAGGVGALTTAVEMAEDSAELGERDVQTAAVTAKDLVVALSASGRTPYALGVLRKARAVGAATVAVVCNRPSPAHALADIVIDPVVGEEILAGSTRLKAGTAQKLVLNMISTGAFVRLGATYGNLMVGVNATNQKLRRRAERIVSEITGRTEGVAEALAQCGYDVRTACIMLDQSVGPEAAVLRLIAAKGSLRRALGR
jgi:N-acetylmuramic acid 6-phosphate etherase